jgi:cytosine/adenosine deaminase-related metal-dependent hydrolase
MIVMPGFVDTHRHIWQGQLRNILPNGRLNPDYMRDIGGTARSVYRPEDVYAGDLLGAVRDCRTCGNGAAADQLAFDLVWIE